MICYYCFFNHGFKFRDYVCNGCHDLSMLCLNISDTAIITVKNFDYLCIMYNINKSEAISLLENSVLEDRDYLSKDIVLIFSQFFVIVVLLFLFSIYKVVDSIDTYKS